MATSENPKLCVTLSRRNAHLTLECTGEPLCSPFWAYNHVRPYIAFDSVVSLYFGVFGGCLMKYPGRPPFGGFRLRLRLLYIMRKRRRI